MDGGVQEFLSLAPGTKFNVVPVTDGNVLVLPIQAPPPPLISDTSSVPLAAASIPTRVQIMQTHVQPLQLQTVPLHQHTAPPRQHLTPPPQQHTAPLQQQQPSLPAHADVYQRAPSQIPVTLSVGVSGGVIGSLDPLALSSADDSLADLQPEDSGGEEEEVTQLTPEQQKLEFMAALGLVPPAVLEEIHRRQQLCRAEYGNWWDRLHSTDFCLVPKTDSGLFQPMTEVSEPSFSHGDVQQVATGPDTGSSVEQITYLTSWPPSSTTEPANTVEVVTQQAPTTVEEQTLSEQQRRNEIAVAAQALREHYMSLVGERQADDPALQATLQQLASAFTFPHSS